MIECVELKLNSISIEELLKFHKDCDLDFEPNLSIIVDISRYCQKIYDYSEIISAYFNQEIAGLIAIYCNDYDNKSAFITSFCVKGIFRQKGIGKMLIEEAEELARNRGMEIIRLEVNDSNHIALNLYKNRGYILDKFKISSSIMMKRLN